MPDSLPSRVAALGQRVADLVDDIDQLRKDVHEYHHRLRGVESAVAMLVDAQKEARRAESSQYRRLEVRVQWLALAVAFAAIVVPVILTVAHH